MSQLPRLEPGESAYRAPILGGGGHLANVAQ
jgi:hypothetical protein